MNRFKTALICMSLLGTLASASNAFACTPPPAYMLESVTVQEYNLPLKTPSMTISTTGGMCPQQVWPFLFDGLTDDQITQYLGTDTSSGTTTTTTYPAWNATAVYVAGDSVSYNGKNYSARWWTQGEAPPGTSGVWQEIVVATAGNPPAWSSTTAYAGGAQVTYQFNIYKAKWWTQGEIPGTQWSAWDLVGPANNVSSVRPAMFHASASFVYDANGAAQVRVIWNTDPFSRDTTPPADSWKVRVDGIVVQQGTNMPLAVADCTGTTSCGGVKYMQSGSFTIPAGKVTDQITFWLCAGNACRMTPRLNWYASGASAGQKPPF